MPAQIIRSVLRCHRRRYAVQLTSLANGDRHANSTASRPRRRPLHPRNGKTGPREQLDRSVLRLGGRTAVRVPLEDHRTVELCKPRVFEQRPLSALDIDLGEVATGE